MFDLASVATWRPRPGASHRSARGHSKHMELCSATWKSQESSKEPIDRTLDFSQLPDSLYKVEQVHDDGWKLSTPDKPKFAVAKLVLENDPERAEWVKRVLGDSDSDISEGADNQADTHQRTDTL